MKSPRRRHRSPRRRARRYRRNPAPQMILANPVRRRRHSSGRSYLTRHGIMSLAAPTGGFLVGGYLAKVLRPMLGKVSAEPMIQAVGSRAAAYALIAFFGQRFVRDPSFIVGAGVNALAGSAAELTKNNPALANFFALQGEDDGTDGVGEDDVITGLGDEALEMAGQEVIGAEDDYNPGVYGADQGGQVVLGGMGQSDFTPSREGE